MCEKCSKIDYSITISMRYNENLTKIQIRFDSSIKNIIVMPDNKNWVRGRKNYFGLV